MHSDSSNDKGSDQVIFQQKTGVTQPQEVTDSGNMENDVASDKILLQSDELIPPLSNEVSVDNSVAIEPSFEMQPISKFVIKEQALV